MGQRVYPWIYHSAKKATLDSCDVRQQHEEIWKGYGEPQVCVDELGCVRMRGLTRGAPPNGVICTVLTWADNARPTMPDTLECADWLGIKPRPQVSCHCGPASTLSEESS